MTKIGLTELVEVCEGTLADKVTFLTNKQADVLADLHRLQHLELTLAAMHSILTDPRSTLGQSERVAKVLKILEWEA